MSELESETSIRQPHEVGFTILSAVGLLILIPINHQLASYWFWVFLLLFLFWFAIGVPPTTKGDHNCIDIKCKYKFHELKKDLSKAKFEIIVLVLLLRPILIIGEYVFPSAEASWTMDPLTVLVFGPLIEEVYFRGILQERLSWIVSDRYAIVLTSGLFAYVHWMPGLPLDIAFLVRFCSGLFFGIAYSKTRNIAVSSIAHFGVNLWGYLSS